MIILPFNILCVCVQENNGELRALLNMSREVVVIALELHVG